MKTDPTKLLYHSLHKRPMPGCLPLFVLLAALVTGGLMCLVQVRLPAPIRPRGVGTVDYRNDELTRFQVRQRSALPLRLPTYADPAEQLPEAPQELPLNRPVNLLPAPPLPITTEPPDSAVLDAAFLLQLPPQEEPADATDTPSLLPETEVEP